MKEAYLYKKEAGGEVRCELCAHRCIIAPGKKGICRVRENRGGTLYSLVYGKAVARNIDPIEKKPFFHFLPASSSFSIATVGCNFRCSYCQNFDISQMVRDGNEIIGENLPPEDVVRLAVEHDCQSISYTYTEPTIFMEYAYDTARLAKEKGLKNNFVTNGYMTEEALRFVHPNLDAANIDLKAFTEKFYTDMCGAKLEPVLSSIAGMKRLGIWVEVTTLIIPTLNDSPHELREIAEFIRGVGEEIPWHVSRFHPTYRVNDTPATPADTLKKAREIGREAGLRYVYTGNIPGDDGENTYCYQCGKLLIRRYGFQVIENVIVDAKCPQCEAVIDGVF
jgi:pyruvate formate lyase activating enzyme